MPKAGSNRPVQTAASAGRNGLLQEWLGTGLLAKPVAGRPACRGLGNGKQRLWGV